MHAASKRRPLAVAALAAAVIGSTPQHAWSGGPDDGFMRFQMFLPTSRILKEAEERGFDPIALITKSRFYDARNDTVDPDKYALNIWTPDDDRFPGLGSWEKFGIPPAWPVWCDLDYEKWDEIFEPQDFSHAEVTGRLQQYIALIEATRELRPNAFICMHGLVRGDLSDASGQLVTEIVTRCDAQSPSLSSNFSANFGNLETQMEVKEARLIASLELKRDYGLMALPLIAKRYRLLDEKGEQAVNELGQRIILLTPDEILEQMIELVLTTEVDGHRVDGVIVWANDNRILMDPRNSEFVIPDTPDQRAADVSDLNFLRLINALVEEHW